MDLQKVEWGGDMDWIDLTQNRDSWVGPCKIGNEPSGSIKYEKLLD
jgi:hypothetical protein